MKKLFSLAIMAIALTQAHAQQDVKIEFMTPSGAASREKL